MKGLRSSRLVAGALINRGLRGVFVIPMSSRIPRPRTASGRRLSLRQRPKPEGQPRSTKHTRDGFLLRRLTTALALRIDEHEGERVVAYQLTSEQP